MIRLDLGQIPDGPLRDAFEAVQREHTENPALAGRLEPRTYAFDGAVTQQKVPHYLPFAPQDAVLSRKTGAGSLTIHYDLFDSDNLVLSTTGPCVVRLLVGTYGST